MDLPYSSRQFVWCQFPFSEDPLQPGPKEHVGYVADVGQIGENVHYTVMALYTTTSQWKAGENLPLGIIPVDLQSAGAMNQKQFVMDARRVAFIPLNAEFFPRIVTPGRGVIHTASNVFHSKVLGVLTQLSKRQDLILRLGPDNPAISKRDRGRDR